MDYKVRCVSTSGGDQFFTVGKIYNVVSGRVTCNFGYAFEAAQYADAVEWLEHNGFKFELVKENNMFTKDDLKVNDWCVLKDGTIAKIFEFAGEKHLFWGKNSWLPLSLFNHQMEEENPSLDKWNIVKVIRPTSAYMLKFDAYERGKVVYDRANGIGCEPPVNEISIADAEKALTEKFGQNVRIRVSK